MMNNTIYPKFLKSNGICTDTRKLNKNDLFFALKGENFNGNKYAKKAINNGALYAIIDEVKYKVNDQYILVNNVLETLQELATYHREQLNIPIIALTGSNGKTTTKELINLLLSITFKTAATLGNLNNHIGVPITLLSFTNNTEFGIVEMGANHFNEIELLSNITKPNFGYITNFGKAHLEGFGSIEGVVKAKTELYQFLKKNNKIAFVNGNDERQIIESENLNRIVFAKNINLSSKTDKNINTSIELIKVNPFVVLKVNNTIIKTNLIGIYNFNNVAAAIAIALYFDIDLIKIKHSLENYYPTNNRSQIIKKGKNQIILDAYNANPISMLAALENINNLENTSKIVIIGDMFELGNFVKEEHKKIVDFIIKSSVDKAYLLGENFHSVHVKNSKMEFYTNFNTFKEEFKKPINKSTILIKASRGMALERVLDLL